MKANKEPQWRRPSEEEGDLFDLQPIVGKANKISASVSRALKQLVRRGLIVHTQTETRVTPLGMNALGSYKEFWDRMKLWAGANDFDDLMDKFQESLASPDD